MSATVRPVPYRSIVKVEPVDQIDCINLAQLDLRLVCHPIFALFITSTHKTREHKLQQPPAVQSTSNIEICPDWTIALCDASNGRRKQAIGRALCHAQAV